MTQSNGWNRDYFPRISRNEYCIMININGKKTEGVDEEDLIINIPKDLRRDVKRHLCLLLLMRVLS